MNGLYAQARVAMLALDSAKGVSGSSLLVPSPKKRSGVEIAHRCEIRTQADREACVRHLYSVAVELQLPPVIYAEEWSPGGRWNFKGILGIGEGWGKWTAEFERTATVFEAVLPAAPVLRVLPQTWRASLFGKKLPKDTEGLKALAVAYVNALLGVHVPPDVAESICVGLYGTRDVSVVEEVRKWMKRKARM